MWAADEDFPLSSTIHDAGINLLIKTSFTVVKHSAKLVLLSVVAQDGSKMAYVGELCAVI